MPGAPFRIVDVFAERRYAGNPLAVFTDGARFSAAEMQVIAREVNFSETTFVVGREGDAHRVRIFTPVAEIPFAGHPTLGTAWVLRETVAPGARELRLALGVGEIPVTFADDGLVWMRQRAPGFGPPADADEAASLVGLRASDLDPRGPPQEVSTGLPFLVVPLRSLAALRRARLDPARYERHLESGGCGSVLVVAPEAYGPGADLAARMFSPTYGVPEDPATGSANGCLAAWLSRHRVLGSERVEAVVDQGHEIGRPSRLHLRAWPEDGAIRVHVGGRVVPVARGEWG